MSVVNLKSTVISNRDATPKVLTDAYVSQGDVKESEGYVNSGAADSIGSTYRLNQVPSNARMSSLNIQNTAMGGSGAVNVGVYYPTFIPIGPINTGLSPSLASTAINASYFASAFAVSSANGPTDIINQSGSNTIANQELPLWQALGLSFDPGIDLDIVATVSTAGTSAGFLGLKSRYCGQGG